MVIVEKVAGIRHNDFVFAGSKGSRGSVTYSDVAGAAAHGSRPTHRSRLSIEFSHWCAEKTNFPSEAAEMALAHAVGDKVEAAYRRGDMFEIRRQLMRTWANFAASPEAPNIIEFRAAAAQ
jgi:hypothetical protein